MRVLTIVLLFLWLSPSAAKPLLPEQVPETLKPWIDWVLQKHPERLCPVHYQQDSRACIWPGELHLAANHLGARFSQRIAVYQESLVELPGDKKHWPVQVRANGESIVVTEHNGAPVIRLQAGEHRVVGNFHWSRLPDAIRINPRSGIIHYQLNDQAVAHPEFRDGHLWLQSEHRQQNTKTPEDLLRIEVYRLLADGHPFRVTTQLDIEVSGSQREVLLGQPLLADFLPLQIESKLPARLEPDGQLRVQVRPGRWRLRVTARHPDNLTKLTMPAQAAPWPGQEVWVYRAAHQDRLTEVEGATQIDPRQVRLPKDWSGLPAYRTMPAERFTLKVLRRGDPEPEPDRLNLERDIWLDFSGEGYTLRDQISGRMTREWRLSADPELQLGRVAIDGKPQFITQLPNEDRKGVEVRRGQLKLTAESRYPESTSELPAIGWGRDFQQVIATLHLPPGWQLLAASGVDNVPSSWLQRWTLYDLFLVLIASLTIAKLWGWSWSLPALLTLALSWHEPGAPQMVWLYLLASIALLRALPGEGKLFNLVRNARRLGLISLLLITLPFMLQQVREGLYPQLERAWITPETLEKRLQPVTQQAQMSGLAGVKSKAMDQAVAVPETARRTRSKFSSMLEYDYRADSSKNQINQVDPNANIQTGPGLPGWQWRDAQLRWNGPVDQQQRLQLYLLSPRAHLVLNLLMIVLILLLAWRCLDIPLRRSAGNSWRQLLVLPLLLIPMGLLPDNAQAGDFPPQALLDELEQRLLELPTRPPRAAIDTLSVEFDQDSYRASLSVQALQETAIPLPLDTRQVTPAKVRLDNQDAGTHLYRSQDNQLWLLLPPGLHQVELDASLPRVEQLQIPLSLRPHRVVVTSHEGWTVEGLDRNGVPDQQLSLTRIRQNTQKDTNTLSPSALPPFVQVEHTLRFGINWEVETRVRRQSPTGSALSLQIPLLPGASLVTGGLRVKEARVLVNMAANQREIRWRSRLDPVETLTLVAASNPGWLESWRADIGPIWHVRIEGIPPIHHQDAGNRWLPAWHPWPGEQITLHISRPAGVPGNTLTIDNSALKTTPGKRATDSVLTLKLRASQGGQHDLTLPPGVQLQAVKINGRTQPIRQDNSLLSLPVVPGEQSFEIRWREMSGIRSYWQTPQLNLGAPSVNAKLSINLPSDRWTLWASGPDLGPAILFWGVLLVLAVVSLILAKTSSGFLPLGFISWLLLGIGLSQVEVTSAALVAGWFFLMYYRSKLDNTASKQHFNLVQVAIVLLTFAFLGILFWAVQQGLLGLPAMQIQGYGSSAYALNWYQDRVAGGYPQATLISVPLLIYRLLMLMWALWLAFSLLRWLKWGWAAFSKHGYWRSIELKAADFSVGWRKDSKAKEKSDEGNDDG